MRKKINNDKLIKKIFESKKKFHSKQSKLPIEEKIKILTELQKIGKAANPAKSKNKKIWNICLVLSQAREAV